MKAYRCQLCGTVFSEYQVSEMILVQPRRKSHYSFLYRTPDWKLLHQLVPIREIETPAEVPVDIVEPAPISENEVSLKIS